MPRDYLALIAPLHGVWPEQNSPLIYLTDLKDFLAAEDELAFSGIVAAFNRIFRASGDHDVA